MPRFTLPAARLAIAATLLSAMALAGASPVLAQTTQTQQETTQTPPAAQAPSKKMRQARVTPAERVEMRIKELHTRLHITQAQEPQWDAVAQAMRDDAKQIGDLLKQRRDNIQNMTAIDDLRSYQQIAQAHADGLQKLTAAFQTLYDGMSPEQKKNADQVFSSFEGRHGHHRGMTKQKQPQQQQ